MSHCFSRSVLFSALAVLAFSPGAVFAQRFDQGADGYVGPKRGGSSGGKYLGKFDTGPKFNPRIPPSGGGYRGETRSNPGITLDFGDIFRAIPSNPPSNRGSTRNNYNDRDYYYNEPHYTRPTQPAPVRPRPVAKVKANIEPPEKIVEPRGNTDPNFPNFELVDSESLKILGDLAEEKAHKSVDDVAGKLGMAAMDPAVEGKLNELRDKIDYGERITDEDIAELGNLVNMVDAAKFPPGFDGNDLTASLDDLIDASQANEYVKQLAVGNNDLPIGQPNGQVLILPALPDGEMMMLPDGGLLVGTGGEGEIGLADEDARDLLDINLGVGEPEPDSEANVAKRVKSGTYLMNKQENGATIKYVIANTNFSMEAGQTQVLQAGRTWVIKFDRGEGNGEAQYTLNDGTYLFGTANGGWELFKQAFSVTIDNADNDNPFYLNIDNEQEEVAARAKKTFDSAYPILVRFDRGSSDDKPQQKRITDKRANLVVAVNPKDGLWDLYPERNFEGIARRSDEKKNNLRQTLLREKLRLSMEKKN